MWFNRGWHLSLLAHLQGCAVHDLAIIFLTSKFSYIGITFLTSLIKLEPRLQVNHLDQLLWLANQKQRSPVKSYLLHSSVAGVMLCGVFHQPSAIFTKMLGQDNFAEPSRHVLTFLHPILIARVILITSGVALMGSSVLFNFSTKFLTHEIFLTLIIYIFPAKL